MNEFELVRSMLLRIAGRLPASAPLAKAVLDWARPHADWLGAEPDWDALLAGLAQSRPSGARPQVVRPQDLELADALAGLLDLSAFDAALLRLMVACDRLPRVCTLAQIAGRHGHDLPFLLGELAGAAPHDAERAVRGSAVVRLGLAGFTTNRQGEVEVDIRWALDRLFDRAPRRRPADDGRVGRPAPSGDAAPRRLRPRRRRRLPRGPAARRTRRAGGGRQHSHLRAAGDR